VDSVPHIYSELVESKELGTVSLSVAQIFGNDTSMNAPSPERRQNVHQRVLADDRARHPAIRVSVRGVGVVKRATREYLETAARRSVDAELGRSPQCTATATAAGARRTTVRPASNSRPSNRLVTHSMLTESRANQRTIQRFLPAVKHLRTAPHPPHLYVMSVTSGTAA
jgi:hypothetical protein